jgi:hypothetical protein
MSITNPWFWVSGTSLEIKLGLGRECWQVHHKLNNREKNHLKEGAEEEEERIKAEKNYL